MTSFTRKIFINQLGRIFYLTLCLFSIFKAFFKWLFNNNIFEYFDEVIFLISLIVFLANLFFKRKVKFIYATLTIFIIYSIVISLLFGVSGTLFTITAQTFINIKFFIIILAFITVFKNNVTTLNKFFLLVVSISAFSVLLQLVLGKSFNEIFNVSTFARPNVRYVGFFTHPNHLAYVFFLYVAYLLNNKFKYNLRLSNKDWFKILASIVVIFLADSRTSILAVLIFLFAFYWQLIKRNYNLIIGVIVSSIILVGGYMVLFTSFIDSIISNVKDTLDLNSHYIRGNMIYLAGLIFFQYFPIGTGASTFGSVLSDTKVFEMYGQANRYYFKNEIGIYDSNIASIIGEYGFIGILFFIGLFNSLIKYLKSFTFRKTLIAPLFLIFIMYMITNPMLTNNLYTILTSIVAVLFVIDLKEQELN